MNTKTYLVVLSDTWGIRKSGLTQTFRSFGASHTSKSGQEDNRVQKKYEIRARKNLRECFRGADRERKNVNMKNRFEEIYNNQVTPF